MYICRDIEAIGLFCALQTSRDRAQYLDIRTLTHELILKFDLA